MKKVMVQPSGMKVINSVEAKECAAGSSCLYMQTEATATSSVVDMQREFDCDTAQLNWCRNS